MPKLSVVGASISEGCFSFIGLASCLGIVVVYKACHAETELLRPIRTSVGSAVAMVVINVKSRTAVKGPDRGR